jgi:hypothetical protein
MKHLLCFEAPYPLQGGVMIANNVVGWFEIYVSDMERARAFYNVVFGKELQPLPTLGEVDCEMWAFPWTEGAPGAAGALVKHALRPPARAAGTIVYFACQDVAQEASRAEAAGGKLIMPRTAIGSYGFIALVVDTEGNTVGLHSMQ